MESCAGLGERIRWRLHGLSPCGRVLHDPGLGALVSRASGELLLSVAYEASFSPCGKFVAVSDYGIIIYKLDSLLNRDAEPGSVLSTRLPTLCSYSGSGVLLVTVARTDSIIELACYEDGMLRVLARCAEFTAPFAFKDSIYVGHEVFDFNGVRLRSTTSSTVCPVTDSLLIDTVKCAVCDLDGSTLFNLALESCTLESFFVRSRFLFAPLLRGYISEVLPGASLSNEGFCLPTLHGSECIGYEPVMFPALMKSSYSVSCAVALRTILGGYAVPTNTLGAVLRSSSISHTSLWDALECVQQAFEVDMKHLGKSQALAAFNRARSMLSDEPALAQELPTEVIDSLCRADRLAFRHHELDACKRVNSVLNLVCAASDKPSDPWCSEEAVNLALSQCGKPAAHAQRAALRLGAELRDDCIVPRFRKLATHTYIENISLFSQIILGTVIGVSPTGEFAWSHGGLYSALDGHYVMGCEAPAFFDRGVVVRVGGTLALVSLEGVVVDRCACEARHHTVTPDGTVYAVTYADRRAGILRLKASERFSAPERISELGQFVDSPLAISGEVLKAGLFLFTLDGELLGEAIGPDGQFVSNGESETITEDMLRALPFSTAVLESSTVDPMLLHSCLVNSKNMRPAVLSDLVETMIPCASLSKEGLLLPTKDPKVRILIPISTLSSQG